LGNGRADITSRGLISRAECELPLALHAKARTHRLAVILDVVTGVHFAASVRFQERLGSFQGRFNAGRTSGGPSSIIRCPSLPRGMSLWNPEANVCVRARYAARFRAPLDNKFCTDVRARVRARVARR